MADLTEAATRPTDMCTTLRGVTAACVDLIPGGNSADVLLITESDRYESLAPTSDLPKSLDQVQQEMGEGPCVTAAAGDAVVRCDDLNEDPRWPRFAKAAVAAEIRSMLSFQLFVHDGRRAALNIMGVEPNSFGPEAEALGAMFATHAALAFIAHNKQSQFESALASRDIIGQAKGRIMERFDVDAVRAFELLVKLSQNSNTRVIDIAAQIVARGSDTHSRN
ncbi:MAG: GAF and ANTAR domain-containing protein [Aldersonia sp.]|nr:GAF and ANTAR domain-containing protein [Aldersonia sp.]